MEKQRAWTEERPIKNKIGNIETKLWKQDKTLKQMKSAIKLCTILLMFFDIQFTQYDLGK